MLKQIATGQDASLYLIEEPDGRCPLLQRYIFSSGYTRRICNDTHCYGVEYTNLLKKACGLCMQMLQQFSLIDIHENKTVVLNILRGGLNFSLREALSESLGWNVHSSSFISAQRRRRKDSPDQWEITEGDYHKLFLCDEAVIVFGDVVATGTSLDYAMDILLSESVKKRHPLRKIIFFTIGGSRAEEVMKRYLDRMKQANPLFEGVSIVYLEGRFTVPDDKTALTIKLPGTDLVKKDALMSPDYIESLWQRPEYAIERCVIYDAGSRAFLFREYAEDVLSYWRQVLALAADGTSYQTYLRERIPGIDSKWTEAVSLLEVARRQCDYFISKLS